MNNQRIRKILKSTGPVLFLLILAFMLIRLAINISQGGFLLVPPPLDEEVDWVRFQSNIKPISIEYPENWRADNLPQGDGRDDDAIAFIRPVQFGSYPYVQIAYRKIITLSPSLELVANWGQSRIGLPVRFPVDGYESISLEKIEVDGREALLRNYRYLDHSSKEVNCYHVYLLDNNDGYTVELCIDQNNDSPEIQAVFDRMIKSISITDS